LQTLIKKKNDQRLLESYSKKFSKIVKSYFEKKDDLPVDFNPFSYLALHNDLVANDVDPSTHYLRHGKFEQRRY